MTITTREQWLGKAVEEFRPVFNAHGFPLPQNIRLSCGFPSRHARSLNKQRIGEHWSPKASDDNTHEILISPVEADGWAVLGILVHELCHASTDGDGHQGRFPSCARALSLEGKPTHATGGEAFKAEFTALFESLGVYPHAKLNVDRQYKKQTTRQLKAVCPCCGYVIRLSHVWASVGLPVCPSDSNTFVLSK
jgi:ribosomal protein L37E